MIWEYPTHGICRNLDTIFPKEWHTERLQNGTTYVERKGCTRNVALAPSPTTKNAGTHALYTLVDGGGGQLLPIIAIGNLLEPNVNGNQGQPLHQPTGELPPVHNHGSVL